MRLIIFLILVHIAQVGFSQVSNKVKVSGNESSLKGRKFLKSDLVIEKVADNNVAVREVTKNDNNEEIVLNELPSYSADRLTRELNDVNAAIARIQAIMADPTQLQATLDQLNAKKTLLLQIDAELKKAN